MDIWWNIEQKKRLMKEVGQYKGDIYTSQTLTANVLQEDTHQLFLTVNNTF